MSTLRKRSQCVIDDSIAIDHRVEKAIDTVQVHTAQCTVDDVLSYI